MLIIIYSYLFSPYSELGWIAKFLDFLTLGMCLKIDDFVISLIPIIPFGS